MNWLKMEQAHCHLAQNQPSGYRTDRPERRWKPSCKWKRLKVGSRNLKKLSIKPSRELTQKLLSLKRTEVRRIVGILTGHCHLRHHLHRIGVHKGCRNCRWCELVDETAEHVLLECEALGRHRLRALGPPGKEQENIMANPVETILNFIRLVNLP